MTMGGGGEGHLFRSCILYVAGAELYGVLQHPILGLQALLLHRECLHLGSQLFHLLR